MLQRYPGAGRPSFYTIEVAKDGGTSRVVQVIPPVKSYPAKSSCRPSYITSDVRGLIWRVYEKLKTTIHDRDVAWYDTGFSAAGPAQGEWIVKILQAQNPEYEYLVSL